jgi:endonuclease YncB( thermonuclease family)
MRRRLAALLLAALASAGAADAPRPALPFIEDDYGRALEQARSRRVPIFIEAWAPW